MKAPLVGVCDVSTAPALCVVGVEPRIGCVWVGCGTLLGFEESHSSSALLLFLVVGWVASFAAAGGGLSRVWGLSVGGVGGLGG